MSTLNELNDENKIQFNKNLATSSQAVAAASSTNANTLSSIMKTLIGAYASQADSPEFAQYIDQAVYSLKKIDGNHQDLWPLNQNMNGGYKHAKENSNSENQKTNDPAVNTPSNPNGSSNANNNNNNNANNGTQSTSTTGQNNGSMTGNSNNNNSNNNDVLEDASIPTSLVKSEIPFNKKEFSKGQRDILRVIGQFLRYMGLNRTTETLIDESGCMLEHPAATTFCSLVMTGSWDEVSLTH